MPPAREAIALIERGLGIVSEHEPELRLGLLSSLVLVRDLMSDPSGRLAALRRMALELRPLVAGLSDREAVAARERWSWIHEDGMFTPFLLGSPEDYVFFLEAGRGQALLEAIGGKDKLRQVRLPEPLLAKDTAARIRVEEAQRRVGEADPQGTQDAEALRAELGAARRDLFEIMERIQREAKNAADLLYPEPVPLASIQSAIAEGEALVLYGPQERVATALIVEMGDAAEIADATRELLGIPSSGPRDGTRGLDGPAEKDSRLDRPLGDPERALARIRALVVDPLRLIEETRTLLVSPQGRLAYLPPSLLFGGRDVALIPSASTYVRLAGEGARCHLIEGIQVWIPALVCRRREAMAMSRT